MAPDQQNRIKMWNRMTKGLLLLIIVAFALYVSKEITFEIRKSNDPNSSKYFQEAQNDEDPTIVLLPVATVRDDGSKDGAVIFPTSSQKQQPTPPKQEDSSSAPKSENLTGDPPICELKSNPKSVILMTLGRSGSGSTWQVMTKLTGEQIPSLEYPGSDSNKINKFFTKKVKHGNNGNWALKVLCSQQKHHPNAGITGFKWKPAHPSITSQSVIETFQVMKKHYSPQREEEQQTNNASIQIVRSRRNLLDVLISQAKHNETERLSSHCKINDDKCLRKQLMAGTQLHLDTENLLEKLQNKTNQENMVDELLKTHGVSHLQVSYEKLYYGGDIKETSLTNRTTIIEEEWMKIFRFLGIGPSQNLTIDTIQKAMEHVPTSNPQHNITLKNYDHVKATLKGTTFEVLLH